ncbi:hypothetical protein LZ30DRAFT_52358 [Colletotrichum cereale]|nr:hypothetical protein LZ30DRAFT_52358 [Colletotrichum cereale]
MAQGSEKQTSTNGTRSSNGEHILRGTKRIHRSPPLQLPTGLSLTDPFRMRPAMPLLATTFPTLIATCAALWSRRSETWLRQKRVYSDRHFQPSSVDGRPGSKPRPVCCLQSSASLASSGIAGLRDCCWFAVDPVAGSACSSVDPRFAQDQRRLFWGSSNPGGRLSVRPRLIGCLPGLGRRLVSSRRRMSLGPDIRG